MEKRKPIISLLLSMLAPGLGQIYNTELWKGLVLQGFFQLAGVGLYILTPYISTSPPVFAVSLLSFILIAVIIHLYTMVDAYRIAKHIDAVSLKAYNKWQVYVILLLIFWGLGACIDLFSNWKSYKFAASSMEPTIHKSDRLIVNKNAYSKNVQPKHGDVIAFIFPEDTKKDFMKRVIAVPGDKIEIRDRGIILNGESLIEDYAKYTGGNDNIIRKMDNMPEIFIPENKYYVLGDNRDKSYDSRFWGLVDRNALIGKAMFIYYSSDKNRIMMEVH